jgi:hypothetical protein
MDNPNQRPAEQMQAQLPIPRTIWEVQVGSGQTLKQAVRNVLITWFVAGVAGYFYWRMRSRQKHGTITDSDWEQLPYLAAFHILVLALFVFVYFRVVLPKVRAMLAELQEEGAATEDRKHSSTTPPSN